MSDTISEVAKALRELAPAHRDPRKLKRMVNRAKASARWRNGARARAALTKGTTTTGGEGNG